MISTGLPCFTIQLPLWRTKVQETCKKSLGLVLALASAAFLSIHSFGLQILTVTMLPSKEIILVNNCISLILCLPLIVAMGKPFFVKHRPDQGLLCLTALLNTVHYACYSYSIRYISFSDATAVFYGHLAFVAVLAWIFLKEPCGFFEIITILITTVGVVFLLQPSVIFVSLKDATLCFNISMIRMADLKSFLTNISYVSLPSEKYTDGINRGYDWSNVTDSNSTGVVTSNSNDRYIGIGLVVAATLLWSICIIIYRKLERIHFITMSFQSYFIGVLVSGALCLVTYPDVSMPTNHVTVLIMTGVGITVFLGRTLLFAGLHFEGAGPVTLVLSTNIVLCYILQLFAFENKVSVLSIVGGTCILLSAIATGVYRMIKEKKELKKSKDKRKGKAKRKKGRPINDSNRNILSETEDELSELLQKEFPRYGGTSRNTLELYLDSRRKALSDDEPETHTV